MYCSFQGISLIIWLIVYTKWHHLMHDNFKIPHPNPEDKNWGLYLNSHRFRKDRTNTDYPPAGHPAGYHFHLA